MEGVRPAGPADTARCVALLLAAAAEARQARGGVFLTEGAVGTGGAGREATAGDGPPAVRDLIRRWSGAADATLLVATFEGVAVGLAAGTIEAEGAGPSGPDGVGVGSLGRIRCCYVEPAARSVGVGSAMVEALLEWFTARGCRGVDALALPGDRSTKQLLETAGFKTRLLVLHRSFG